MNKLIYIVFGIGILIFSVGCVFISDDCYYPDSPNSLAPAWVCSGHEKGLKISATGYAEKSSLGRNFMQQMALTNARATLVRLLAGKNTTVIRRASATITITARDLEQTKIVKSIRSPKGGLYVLVKFGPSH